MQNMVSYYVDIDHIIYLMIEFIVIKIRQVSSIAFRSCFLIILDSLIILVQFSLRFEYVLQYSIAKRFSLFA